MGNKTKGWKEGQGHAGLSSVLCGQGRPVALMPKMGSFHPSALNGVGGGV